MQNQPQKVTLIPGSKVIGSGGNGGPSKIITSNGPIGAQGQFGPPGPKLSQGGQHPPLNPAQGDLWIDQFGDVHCWQGNYWVKMQGAGVASVEAKRIGSYDGYHVYFGDLPPAFANNTYWVTENGRTVFEAVNKSLTPYGVSQGAPADMWQEVLDQPLRQHIQEFVATMTTKFPEVAPEVVLAPQTCTPEEAEEKLQAFEEIIKPTGRLDSPSPMQGLLNQIQEINKNPATYERLSTKMITDFINDLFKP